MLIFIVMEGVVVIIIIIIVHHHHHHHDGVRHINILLVPYARDQITSFLIPHSTVPERTRRKSRKRNTTITTNIIRPWSMWPFTAMKVPENS